jgi:hypothetical protein
VIEARALRLALLAWGLGDLALGRRVIGSAWMAAEVAAIAVVVFLALTFGDTSWYLLPFLAGAAFLVLWATQAAFAYRAAQAQVTVGEVARISGGSPAAALVWLTIPMLVWGAGFWLVAGTAASPAAVVDRFVTQWPDVADGRAAWEEGLAADPAALTHAAVASLAAACALDPDAECAHADVLLRGLRLHIAADGERRATAVAELVRYERRAASFLGIFGTTELVPVPVAEILTLTLVADAAPFGSERWIVVNAETP